MMIADTLNELRCCILNVSILNWNKYLAFRINSRKEKTTNREPHAADVMGRKTQQPSCSCFKECDDLRYSSIR